MLAGEHNSTQLYLTKGVPIFKADYRKHELKQEIQNNNKNKNMKHLTWEN